ncbi:hypothetical protein BS732_3974 [Bacillus subtilis MB73/2]|nr:hypothetical protein BS732_3974 [Bacillus subtilis MB73/2]
MNVCIVKHLENLFGLNVCSHYAPILRLYPRRIFLKKYET